MSRFLTLRVAHCESLHPLIRRLVLESPTGEPLPGFSAGAHVRVGVTLPDGSPDWRHYSLINTQPLPGATRAPMHYEIAIRREDEGRGGSRFVHTLARGDAVQVSLPENDFPLQPGSGPVLLVAGGIGVTPLLSMAAELRAGGRRVRMVYASRSRSQMAYLEQLQNLLADDLQVHSDEEAGGPLDAGALLDGCAQDEAIYVCGPSPMLDAVLAGAKVRAWQPGRVQFELFGAAAPAGGDHAFDVVLSHSGVTHRVAVGQSILDCLLAHGEDPIHDCDRGECGVCAVPVIDGEVDHRDYVLSDAEKATHRVIQICVSRARGERLVLDL